MSQILFSWDLFLKIQILPLYRKAGFKDLKAPMNHLKLLPTGGINLHNIVPFLKAGGDGLGIGSQLFDKHLIKEKNWIGLKAHFQEFIKKLNTDKHDD